MHLLARTDPCQASFLQLTPCIRPCRWACFLLSEQPGELPGIFFEKVPSSTVVTTATYTDFSLLQAAQAMTARANRRRTVALFCSQSRQGLYSGRSDVSILALISAIRRSFAPRVTCTGATRLSGSLEQHHPRTTAAEFLGIVRDACSIRRRSGKCIAKL